jgi:hypothetical protein
MQVSLLFRRVRSLFTLRNEGGVADQLGIVELYPRLVINTTFIQ